MKTIKKQLAVLSTFLAINIASSAMFDAEIKIVTEPYTFASETFVSKGKEKECFTSTYPLNQAFQNFGALAQAQYNIVGDLYIGLCSGFIYDRAFSGKINIPISYLDSKGNPRTNHASLKDNRLDSIDIKSKGGFFNIPLLALVKYDLPVNLKSYSLNTYVIAKGGFNICISNEDSDENKEFTGKVANFGYGLGGGLEYYGMQFELMINGMINRFKATASKHTNKITFNHMNETKGIDKTYSRIGFSASIGYRLPIL